jgi:hypothetical protein
MRTCAGTPAPLRESDDAAKSGCDQEPRLPRRRATIPYFSWVENYCRTTPRSNFGNGVTALATEIHSKRQRSATRTDCIPPLLHRLRAGNSGRFQEPFGKGEEPRIPGVLATWALKFRRACPIGTAVTYPLIAVRRFDELDAMTVDHVSDWSHGEDDYPGRTRPARRKRPYKVLKVERELKACR